LLVCIRLKSLSDDDLVTVLEQVHNGSFLLSLAAPSLHDPGTDDNPSSAPPRLSDNPPANPDAASLTDRQATHSFASSGSTSPQRDGTQSTEEQPATAPEAAVGKSPELPQTGQEGKAAGQSLPDAWQQQTYRLQAFTRPLMQRLQGELSHLLVAWAADAAKQAVIPVALFSCQNAAHLLRISFSLLEHEFCHFSESSSLTTVHAVIESSCMHADLLANKLLADMTHDSFRHHKDCRITH